MDSFIVTEPEETLKKNLAQIGPLSRDAMGQARARWDAIAKPLHGLGQLEDDVVRIAGITGRPQVQTERKALYVLCADNGVVAEGVTQTGQAVTATMAAHFLDGQTCASVMAAQAGVDLFPVDIGMARDTDVPARKVAYGTQDLAVEDAMTRAEAVSAIQVGFSLAAEAKEAEYDLLLTGEMGIGNTTTSSAVSAVLLGENPEAVTGKGAGLSDAAYAHKVDLIGQAIRARKPDPADPLDVLAKLGGLDLAGITGLCLGGAFHHLPVVLDGFISDTAALIACRLCPNARAYLLPAHRSKEPGAEKVLEALSMQPGLDFGCRLGEGTGAILYVRLLDEAVAVYQKMATFGDNEISAYQEYET